MDCIRKIAFNRIAYFVVLRHIFHLFIALLCNDICHMSFMTNDLYFTR